MEILATIIGAKNNSAIRHGGFNKDELAMAAAIMREVAKKSEQIFGAESFPVFRHKINLASSLAQIEKPEEAEIILRDIFQKVKQTYGEEGELTPMVMNNLAMTLYDQHESVEAELLLRKVVRIQIRARSDNVALSEEYQNNLKQVLTREDSIVVHKDRLAVVSVLCFARL